MPVIITNADESLFIPSCPYCYSAWHTDFQAIDQFFSRSGREFELAVEQPVITQLGQPITSLPPALPEDAGMFNASFWSLKLRYRAYQHTPDNTSNLNRIRF
ncbi:hypothetical protein [Methylophaga sp.]|uniref:hypothetical protein n=1 Tax=Methylophaga sp. TaxID=2024840 RepID=UPI0013FFB991|nr:hypothetical protein [Methylophaga sp.]MTI64354.1 hypothetical protein [Methylophaga sp.]